MKKLLSLLLACVLLCSAFVPVYAVADAPVAAVEAQSGVNWDTVRSEVRAFLLRVVDYFRMLFGGSVAVPVNPPETMKAPDGSEMHLAWNDEFNGDSLDRSKWNFRAKMNQGDIKNTTDERNVKVEDGNLVLRSWKEENGYSTNTSVTTDGVMSFRYGYLEIYANVPYVEGCWPSFWMQSKDVHRTVDYLAEIDVFEIYDTQNTVSSDIHKWYSGEEHFHAGGRKWSYKFRRIRNLNHEYHLYGLGWTPDELYFTVDRKIYQRVDLTKDFGERGDGMDGFRDPAYIIFNNFIFTDNSSWKNPPVNDKTQWPITYKIDWIRLYQKDGEGEILDDTAY